MASKRKREKEPGKTGTHAKGNGALISKGAEPSVPSLTEVEGLVFNRDVPPAVLTACRSALVRSPAASRVALDKHRASIDPDLAKALEIVGGYDFEDERTPLHESVRQGDVSTTQALIAAGADVNAKDKNDATPFDISTKDTACWAILKHHATVLAILQTFPDVLVSTAVAHCASLTSSDDSIPATALSLSPYQLDGSFLWAPPKQRAALFAWAKNAFKAQVAALTCPFADLPEDCAGDILDYLRTRTPRQEFMRIVAHCSSPEAHAWVRAVVAAAVAAAAAPELWIAAKEGNLAMVQDCLAKGASVFERFNERNGNVPIIISSCNGHTDIVEVLLEAGACVHTRDNHGCTALYWASCTGKTATVKRLIEAGAEVNITCLRGETPFFASHGRIETMKVLLDAGADIDAKDEEGQTVLICTSTSDKTDIVKLLLERGADMEAEDKNGHTALICAISDDYGGCYDKITKLLIEAGANTEAVDEFGKTALIMAAEQGYDEDVAIIKQLLRAGTNKDAEDDEGQTALIHASREGHTAIVKLLLRAGADKDVKDEGGKTALMHAALDEKNDIVKLLL